MRRVVMLVLLVATWLVLPAQATNVEGTSYSFSMLKQDELTASVVEYTSQMRMGDPEFSFKITDRDEISGIKEQDVGCGCMRLYKIDGDGNYCMHLLLNKGARPEDAARIIGAVARYIQKRSPFTMFWSVLKGADLEGASRGIEGVRVNEGGECTIFALSPETPTHEEVAAASPARASPRTSDDDFEKNYTALMGEGTKKKRSLVNFFRRKKKFS